MIKVGVVLPRPPDDPGEWLGAAAAFEAAGADALWLDHGRAPRHDPLVLVAALAALTYRARLVAAVTEAHPAALTTLAHLSRNRLALIAEDPENPENPENPEGREDPDPDDPDGPADAGVTGEPGDRVAPGGPDELGSSGGAAGLGGSGGSSGLGGLGGLGGSSGLGGSGGVGGVGEGIGVVWRLADGSYREELGRWSPAPVPLGRTAWRETLRQAAERGEYGVLVPADPRLLDLLRNPDDPEGRQDLQLAQG